MSDATRLEQASLVVPGVRSELRVESGRVTVSRQVTTQADPSEVTFSIGAVRATTLRRPTRSEQGWLHVAVVGGTPAPVGELAASSDPYTLPLGTRRQARRARKFARLVARHVRMRGLPADQAAAPTGTVRPASRPASRGR